MIQGWADTPAILGAEVHVGIRLTDSNAAKACRSNAGGLNDRAYAFAKHVL